ncbi:MAG: cell division protein ZapA [Deltaproteobacteria bacterium]
MTEKEGQNPERLIKFEVFGHEYSLFTAAPEDEVEEILQLVKSQFEKLVPASSRIVSDKIAVLTCLNMAGEVVKMRKEIEQFKRQANENIGTLVKRIESSL